MGYAETDTEAKALLGEFTHALSEFGWIEHPSLGMDVRWAPAKTDLMRTYAKELVSLQPDLILTDFDTGNRCCKTRDYHYPERERPAIIGAPRVHARACDRPVNWQAIDE